MLANVVLACLLWHQPAFLRTEASAPAETVPPGLASDPSPSGPKPQQVPPERFDWRQIEASDYPAYIANLRAIHCPEQTVRDIITADVANLFARHRRDSASVGRWSLAEEARFVASLLGEPARSEPSAPTSTEFDPRHRENPATQAAEPVCLPLVLQTQALASLKLDAEQSAELRELAQQFIQEIGGVNQDPSDPAYLARWQQARPKFDGLIVNVIGRRALVDLDQAMPAPEGGAE